MARTVSIALTPEQFAEQRTRLIAEKAITLPDGNKGEVSARGVALSYVYDGAEKLVITIEHKPFLLPESTVTSTITDWFTPKAIT